MFFFSFYGFRTPPMPTLCAFDLYLALRLKTIGERLSVCGGGGEKVRRVFENLCDRTEWMKRSAYVAQDCGILYTKFINYYVWVWVCVEPLTTMPNDRPYCWIETILLSGTQWCLCTRRTHRHHPRLSGSSFLLWFLCIFRFHFDEECVACVSAITYSRISLPVCVCVFIDERNKI